MQQRSFKRELYLLLSCFIVSRVIIQLLGVTFGYNALFEYWQYLDVKSLSSNLLQSLWYLHAQPPVFNFILGIILKCSGIYTLYIIEVLLLVVTFCNGLFILRILRMVISKSNLPLIISLLYILSPATILFENELFYTTFTSLLLLMAAYFIIKFNRQQSWQNAWGIFTALSLVCLTRSMYHIIWLLIVSGVLIFMWGKGKSVGKLVLASLLAISLVGGWYLKNYILFDTFSASSWVGMNFSRIVFQNNKVMDSTNIASIHTFMPISYYKNYISGNYKKKYEGRNDRILLMETKNDRYINMNNAGYLEVSKKYKDACMVEIKHHPLSYIKNVFTAFIIFFTPASSYFKVGDNDYHIRYYDLVCSFNFSQFITNDYKKKLSLVMASIPQFLLYGVTFIMLLKVRSHNSSILALNIFIGITILFSIAVSSMFDYGENMRFRYEIQPLFLILLAQAIDVLINRRNYKNAGFSKPMKA